MPACLPDRAAWLSQNEAPVTMAPNPSITAVSTATLAASSARRAGTAAKVTRTSPDAYSPTRDIAPRAPAARSSAMPALLVNATRNEPPGAKSARRADGYSYQFRTSASAASTLSTTMPMVQHRWVAQQCGGDAEALPPAQREAADPGPRGVRRPDFAQHLVHPPQRDRVGAGEYTEMGGRASPAVDVARVEQRADMTQTARVVAEAGAPDGDTPFPAPTERPRFARTRNPSRTAAAAPSLHCGRFTAPVPGRA